MTDLVSQLLFVVAYALAAFCIVALFGRVVENVTGYTPMSLRLWRWIWSRPDA
jgi:hypothetical protein